MPPCLPNPRHKPTSQQSSPISPPLQTPGSSSSPAEAHMKSIISPSKTRIFVAYLPPPVAMHSAEDSSLTRFARGCPFISPFLLVPGSYSLVVLSVHAWNSEAPALAVLLLLVLGLAICAPFGHSCFSFVCAKTPAYSVVAAHISTVIVTFLVRLPRAIGAGVSTTFLLVSSILSFLFWRIITSDPGRLIEGRCVDSKWDSVVDESHPNSDAISSGSISGDLRQGEDEEINHGMVKLLRGKYCHRCNFFIKRYDHHCAAIGNCVGSKNHGLFLLLLKSFILAEVLYSWCCFSYLKEQRNFTSANKKTIRGSSSPVVEGLGPLTWQIFIQEPWIFSTAMFVGVQTFWQVPLLIFHLYCIATNLTTDEWVNWAKYSRFYVETSPGPGCPFNGKKFVNPYDHGTIYNISTFFHEEN